MSSWIFFDLSDILIIIKFPIEKTMKSILDKIQNPTPTDLSPFDLVEYYKKQFDEQIMLGQEPDWILDLLAHFRSLESSQLKSVCEENPEQANRLLSYLDNRYKYSQIINQSLKNPAHSLRLLKQRLEFDTETYRPFADELKVAYSEISKIQRAYNTHHRSKTLLSKVSLAADQFLSNLISLTLEISSIPFALFLATHLSAILSLIEWGLLDLASGGNYTENLKDLPLDKERLLSRLNPSVDIDDALSAKTIDDIRNNYLKSARSRGADPHFSAWVWEWRHISREQDSGITHLSLVIKTFYKLTTASLKCSSFGWQSLEVFLRLRYILLGLIFLTMAIGIQAPTEYLPNIAMSALVITKLVLDLCLYHLLIAPFYEKNDAFDLNQLQKFRAQYPTVTSPIKGQESNPERDTNPTKNKKCTYFFERCAVVNTRLLKDYESLTLSSMTTRI